MKTKIMYQIKINRILLIALFLIILFQVMSISSLTATNELDPKQSRSRQIGKSDVTIVTADVYNAGLDVPDEYVNEVAMIQFSDPEPIEGERITINATVFNVGTRGASATVYFYDGPPEEKDLIGKDNLSIHAFGYQVASTPWNTTGEEELHTIYVLINPEDPENESSNDNNQASRDITVNQIPIAQAGPDLGIIDVLYEDEQIRFDGSSSTDTQSDLKTGLIYTWNFNDPYADDENPSFASGNNLTYPTHIFTHQGFYEVNLTVLDDGGASATDSLVVKITNSIPITEFQTSLENVNEDDDIIFDAKETWDTNSDKLELIYYWDFGDGSDTGWINDSIVNHTYPFEGKYTVKLTVRDNDGESDSASQEITVNNLAPIADAGTDITSFESNIKFDGSGSWDTPTDLKKLNYRWSFGDSGSGYGKSVMHNYTKKGNYQVDLTVTDDNGEQDIDSISVTIKNLSPVAIIKTNTREAIEDDEIYFEGVDSYDPDGELLSYHWDFDDGTTADGVSTNHVFIGAGDYQVTLTVQDEDNVVNKDSILIKILNVNPVANGGPDREVFIGELILFNARNSTDTPSDLPELRYFWDFGDNTTEQGLEVIHSYVNPGTYNVTLRVLDDDDAFDIHKIIVYVRDALLSSISLTVEISKTKCRPGETVEITGELDFEFENVDFLPDYALARVRVEILETKEYWFVNPEPDGVYSLNFAAPNMEGTYTVKVSITRLGLLAEETVTFRVDKPGSIQQGSYFTIDPTTTIIVVTVGSAAGGLGAFTAGTDLGRYKLFTLLIPLYSRLNRDALLDNFTRGRIYEHIRMNPGMHYRAIKENLGLSNGSLAYHLRVLEKESYIQSSSDGFCKRFYPRGMKISKTAPNNVQESILDMICERPFITQKELARELGLDISTVNYHINLMAGAGIIKAEKYGRTKHYIIEAEVVEPIS